MRIAELDSVSLIGRIQRMPALALIVCPLPQGRLSLRVAQSVLAELARDPGVVIFCPEPYQAPAAWERKYRLLPLADLPHERATGTVGAPVYLIDGEGEGEAALTRYIAEVKGVCLAADKHPDAATIRRAALSVKEHEVMRPVPRGPTVEAMVLAYKSKDYIAPCLDSLLLQDYPGLKITVMDNASGDGTADYVRKHYPTIDVLESRVNLGFAAGHNVLFDRTRADYVVLLNHDAVARRNFVSELVAAAEAKPTGAVFGAKMLMRRCPTIYNSTGIVMHESGFAYDRDIGRMDRRTATEPERIFAVCGGAMLIRGSVLRAIGGFDPTFFMYVEDVDFCWRARIAGHEVYYVPLAACVHDWHGDLAAAGKPKSAEGQAVIAEREGRRRFMIERNRLLSVAKNYDKRNYRRIWSALCEYDRGRIAALVDHCRRGGGSVPQKVLEAVRTAHSYFRRHALSVWWARRKTQKLRRVPDASYLSLIVPSVHEPSGVGDLHAIVDRYCAEARSPIVMAVSDKGALGPGWHHPEPGEGGQGGLRWSMAECWFFLKSEQPSTAVRLSVVPQPLPSWAELWADGICVGRQELPAGVSLDFRWQLPDIVPAGQVIECRVLCKAFVPRVSGMGGDDRELGLHVCRINAE